MRAITALAVAAVLIVGCGRDERREPTYKGVTVSRWVQLAGDADGATAEDAWRALRNFTKDDPGVVAALEDGTRRGSLVAMKSLYLVSHDPKPIVAWVRSELSGANGYVNHGWEIIDLVGTLGSDAKPLLPDLKQAAGKFGYDDQPKVKELIAFIETN